MTARPAPPAAPRDAARQVTPSEVLDVLRDALRPKLDGTRHHWGCLNKTVNSSPTDCSDRCVKANGLVATDDAARRARGEAG